MPERVPVDAAALAAALPDAPCWVETRGLLLSGDAIVRGPAAGEGALVLDPSLPSGFLVGRPPPAFLREALSDVPAGFELVVQSDALDDARTALPGWSLSPATVLSPAAAWSPTADAQPDVVLCAPPEQRWLERIPEADEMRFYASLAEAVALRLADGEVVAVCAAGDVTETLWDVGIDTVAGHRHAGHATAAFRALAAYMAAAGQQPVWCTEDSNHASLAMAARLGFEPVGRLGILTRASPPARADRYVGASR